MNDETVKGDDDMKVFAGLILTIALALAGYAYSANADKPIEPVNRYFDHTGKYYTMEVVLSNINS